jgi:phage-related baseplate assembly protein
VSDGAQYGVVPDGFELKGIDTILAEHQERARDIFGEDVDLTSGSVLRKLLDAASWQAHELWKALESQYYSSFITTADGAGLDLLGTDIGVARLQLRAQGEAELTLSGGVLDRRYTLPEGTILVTGDTPPKRFRTVEPLTLTGPSQTATVPAEAMTRGPGHNIGAQSLVGIAAGYPAAFLNLDTATVVAANPQPFSDGELFESDVEYRGRLRAFPRSLWTLDRVHRTVLEVDGVRDCLVFDPFGGVDVGQSYFNMFLFGQRAFSLERRLASPYYFDVVVATEPGWPWFDSQGVVGVLTRVTAALREVRPISIFANVVPANLVEIGVRATLEIEPGHDRHAILAAIVSSIRRHVAALNLGRDVLYSDVIVIARNTAGVTDVQNLHLRRCPTRFGGANFGGALFRQTVEAAVGENVELAPDEIPFFEIDSKLIEVDVVER